MFIVIEGTDASGKTSLIAAVNQEVHRRYPDSELLRYHKGRPEQESRRWVLYDYVNSIESLDLSNKHLVSDRWHWGEITYAPKYRPHTNIDGFGLLGKAGWRWVELFLMSRGVASFWLYQPLAVIQQRLQARGDEFVQVEDLKEILSEYSTASAMSASLTKVLYPEANSMNMIPALASEIVDIAEENAAATKFIVQEYPMYIGNPRPKVLLIGDKRNITDEYGEETKLPFMPVDGNSGEFLLNSLPTDLWPHVGIVNGNDIAPEILFSLWQDLHFPPVAILGREAEKAVEKTMIPKAMQTVLGHPQYIRRFNYKDRADYGLAIQRIANKEIKGDDPWILR